MFATEIFRQLTANFLITMLFLAIWATLATSLSALKNLPRALLAGVFMGIGAVVSLLYGVNLEGGFLADLRAIPLAVAGLFGGPIAGLVATAVAAMARASMGGAGVWPGLLGIALAGACGIAFHRLRERMGDAALALIFSTTLILVQIAPASLSPVTWSIVIQVSLFKFIGAAIGVYAMAMACHAADERRLLQAAIAVAPDYLYIKNPRSQLVAYNSNVAALYHADRTALIGKTDLDLAPDERGERLFADEQMLFAQRRPLRGSIDKTCENGVERWFQSSKTLVTDADDRVIGLVGISRDITEDRLRQRDSEASAELWSLVLSQMADGVALFDQDCNFIYCNDQYHDLFAATRQVRQPGTPLRTVLQAALTLGEQITAPNITEEDWVETVLSGIRGQRNEEVNLANGSYVSVRNRIIPNLGYVSVASDITEIRETEHDLAELTLRLSSLAATDPLTGIANRRALDEQFAREMSRSIRQDSAISAVMIDVDRFKNYNDIYGHGFGDSCLKLLAEAMKSAAGRQTDIVARYGGEEFCIILPETDEAGALVIAERLRQAIVDLAIPHQGCEAGIVTISLGIGAYSPGQASRTCEDLLLRADQALYAAKNAGRNRVMSGPMAA